MISMCRNNHVFDSRWKGAGRAHTALVFISSSLLMLSLLLLELFLRTGISFGRACTWLLHTLVEYIILDLFCLLKLLANLQMICSFFHY